MPDCLNKNEICLPFLKWAGGKRWLIQGYSELLPQPSGKYIEPFLGSGAVFFHLNPKAAILSDVNAELINTFRCVRDDWARVYSYLQDHAKLHSDEYYYSVRSMIPENEFRRAAKFIYLNRTCWNGLYRVNKKGVFNVPRGSKNSVVLSTDDFELVSRRLEGATISCADFEESVDQAEDGDLLFVDPPYTVMHNNNGFVKYNENIFSWDDQVRLKDSLARASIRGAKIILTNADHDSVKNLYSESGFDLVPLSRNSVISGVSTGRGKSSELIITNKVIKRMGHGRG